MEPNAQSNPLSGLHQQKLYSLILAGVGLVSMLLAWRTYRGITITNGFSGLGLIALLGIAGVVVACFMGDKSKPFEGQTRQIALGSFGAIALAAVLVMVTKYSSYGYKASTSPGLGAFLAIAVAAAGLLFLLGILKVPQKPNAPKP